MRYQIRNILLLFIKISISAKSIARVAGASICGSTWLAYTAGPAGTRPAKTQAGRRLCGGRAAHRRRRRAANRPQSGPARGGVVAGLCHFLQVVLRLPIHPPWGRQTPRRKLLTVTPCDKMSYNNRPPAPDTSPASPGLPDAPDIRPGPCHSRPPTR